MSFQAGVTEVAKLSCGEGDKELTLVSMSSCDTRGGLSQGGFAIIYSNCSHHRCAQTHVSPWGVPGEPDGLLVSLLTLARLPGHVFLKS